jgi:hypothetical protein
MRTRILLATLAAAALAPAAAHATPTTSLHLELPGTKSTYVDTGRKGYSPGDYFLSSGRLLNRASHKLAGRLGGAWTILSRSADHATFDLGLANGTIFVSGRISHTAASSTLTLTGGTGRYRGSHGTLTFRYLSQTTAALDIQFDR